MNTIFFPSQISTVGAQFTCLSPFPRGLLRNPRHMGLHMPSVHKPRAGGVPAPFAPNPHSRVRTRREATPRTQPWVPLPLRAPHSCGPFQAHGAPPHHCGNHMQPLHARGGPCHMRAHCAAAVDSVWGGAMLLLGPAACHGRTYFPLFFCILYGFIQWSISVWVLIIRYDKMVSHVLPPRA